MTLTKVKDLKWIIDGQPVIKGNLLKYTADEFDGHTEVIGTVSEVTKDHFIIHADGMSLWIDQDNLSNVSII